MHTLRRYLYVTSLLLLGCTTPNPMPSSMSYEVCRAGSICSIAGRASAQTGEHGRIVRLDTADRKCVSVSTTEADWEAIRNSGPVSRVFSGYVYDYSFDEDGSVDTLIIKDRRIGYTGCSPFFIFAE